MTTTVYFVRHAEPNYHNHDDLTRELTIKGLQDCQRLIPFFKDITINQFYSSPYKRAIDTIAPLAEQRGKAIQLVDNFRERKIDNQWIEDFADFCQKQWQDKTYKLANGESLQEVTDRQLLVLNQLLDTEQGKTLLVGSHGTAISCLINYYQEKFGYDEFKAIKNLFPFVLKFVFEERTCSSIKLYNIFTGETNDIYSI